MFSAQKNIINDARTVLSDTLPYETPLIFSNIGLYKYITGNKKIDIIEFIINKKSFTKPYEFKVKNKPNRERTISVMHPSIQLRIANLYKNYSQLIIYLCTRSKISLRAPKEISTKYIRKSGFIKSTNTQISQEEVPLETASTFFVNKKFDFLYKFYLSRDFESLEKRFLKYVSVDIQQCFPSIYTHSIAWAIKGKSFSKDNKDAMSFERQIDQIMQHANHNETHGILVGSEFSRIFAEIILQKIDCNIVERLSCTDLTFDRDYSIRRYVDDYFIFYNDEAIFQQVLSNIIICLEEYKLFINESKTTLHERPFITIESIAKIKISEFIKDTFSSIDIILGSDTPYSVKSSSIISRFKMIIKECGVELHKILGYSLSKISTELSRLVDKLPDKITNTTAPKKFIANIIDLSYFILAMHGDNSATNSICKIIVLTGKLTEKTDKQHAELIQHYIYIQTKDFFKNLKKNTFAPRTENLNILITCAHCNILRFFNIQQIKMIFNISYETTEKDIGCLGYFSIITLIYIAFKYKPFPDEQFQKTIQLAINNNIPEKCLDTADGAMLFMDIVACPYLEEDFRKSFFLKCLAAVPPEKKTDHDISFQEISSRSWFTEWAGQENISILLHKKEIRTPY